MNRDTQKFNSEILALKSLKRENTLHPLLKEQIKHRMVNIILSLPKNTAAVVLPVAKRLKILRYLAPAAAGILLCAGTVFASSGSGPGDTLYPVKLAKENIELTFAPTAKAKAQVRATQAENRLTELEKINSQSSKITLRQQTESTTKTQVASAIKNLAVVKKQLAAQGDVQGAAQLGNNISDLKEKAKRDKIFTGQEQKEIDGAENIQ